MIDLKKRHKPRDIGEEQALFQVLRKKLMFNELPDKTKKKIMMLQK